MPSGPGRASAQCSMPAFSPSHLACGFLGAPPTISGPKCVKWGLLPSTDVLVQTQKKVQSGHKRRAWAEEKVATNTYAKATPQRTGSPSPSSSSVLHPLCPAPQYRTWQLTATGHWSTAVLRRFPFPFSPLHLEF